MQHTSDEIVSLIFRYLDTESLLVIPLVCKHFRDIARDPALWKLKLMDEFGISDITSGKAQVVYFRWKRHKEYAIDILRNSEIAKDTQLQRIFYEFGIPQCTFIGIYQWELDQILMQHVHMTDVFACYNMHYLLWISIIIAFKHPKSIVHIYSDLCMVRDRLCGISMLDLCNGSSITHTYNGLPTSTDEVLMESPFFVDGPKSFFVVLYETDVTSQNWSTFLSIIRPTYKILWTGLKATQKVRDAVESAGGTVIDLDKF